MIAEEKKIIIDDDWKAEAEAEKERLSAEVEQKQQRPKLSEIQASFALLIHGTATQALMALGEMENPFTGERSQNLDEAKFHIDMLEVLETKTKNNLTPEEASLMKSLLFDLRMRFVQVTQGKPAS